MHNTFSLYKKAIKDGHLDEEITFAEFSKVIRGFNQRMCDKIVEGYVFKSPIGKIEIKRKERKARAVDWKASLDCKAEVLAQGLTPYSKENPEGVKWFRYHMHNVEYIWIWTRHTTFSYWKLVASRVSKIKVGRYISEKVKNDTIKEVDYEFL